MLTKAMRLPPAVLAGNSEVVNDHLILLNIFVREGAACEHRNPTPCTSCRCTPSTRM